MNIALRIRLRHHHIQDENDRIPLYGKGSPEVEYETGKMVFRNTDSEAMCFSLQPLSDRMGQPGQSCSASDLNEKKLLIIQEKSENGSRVSQLLLGGGK